MQVKLLVEQGRANVAARDRWGHTALDEAQHAGAASVLEYLSRRWPAGGISKVTGGSW
jgi:ankyrin repeat protein